MKNEVFSDFNKVYTNKLKDEHLENTTKYFDDLVAKSGIDIQANRELVKKVEQNEAAKQIQVKKLKRLSALLWIILIVGLLTSLIFIFRVAGGLSNLYIILIVALLLITGVSVFFLHKKTKELRDIINHFNQIIEEDREKCWKQMYPLNSLFDSGISNKLLKETFPMLEMDDVFDSRQYDLLTTKYGLYDDRSDPRSSVLYCQSGKIQGNPYLIGKQLEFSEGQKRYHGTLTISWTSRDAKGNVHHHTQQLHAYVDKFYPVFENSDTIFYGNEASPNLWFSRFPKNVDEFSEKKLERHIKSQTKALERKERKQTRKGEDFTLSGNLDFEVLFNAIDRNNEQEFRLLFTPAAQTELIKLIKNEDKAGEGDEFAFIKRGMLNVLSSHSLRAADLRDRPQRYYDYSYDKIRDVFIKFNTNYFRVLYFNFAPILAIPLYYQHKPHEYIYRDVYPSYYSTWQHEEIVNSINETLTKHPDSITENILKTKLVHSNKLGDTIKVTSYGFTGINRTDYVRVLGGDRRYHNVPVHWVEYIPVSKDSMFTATRHKLNYLKYAQISDTLIEKLSSKLNLLYTGSILTFDDIADVKDDEIDSILEIIEDILASDTPASDEAIAQLMEKAAPVTGVLIDKLTQQTDITSEEITKVAEDVQAGIDKLPPTDALQ